MRSRIQFTKSDVALIALGIFLICSSSYFYFWEVSPRTYLANFFPSLRPKNFNEQVGVLRLAQGTVRRQQAGKTEFERIADGAPLFNSDTLVTSREAGAVVELSDGGKIELGPDTMIRLQLESKVSLEGITRIATLDLVAGEIKSNTKDKTKVRTSKGEVLDLPAQSDQKLLVEKVPIIKPIFKPKPKTTIVDANSGIDLTGQEVPMAPPSPEAAPTYAPPPPAAVPSLEPSPIPLSITLKKPSSGARFEVPKGSNTAAVSVPIELEATQTGLQSKLSLFRINGTRRDKVLEREQTGEANLTRGSISIESPGKYVLEIEAQQVKKKASIEVLPEFEGLVLDTPLVGGSSTRSNEYQGQPIKNFEIVLHWKPFTGAKEYVVDLLDPEKEKPLLTRKVAQPEYRFNKNVVFKGKFKYRISAILKSGFRVRSPMSEFEFSYIPPELTQPFDGAKVTSRGSVLLTWTRTNFTQQYELEVFSDAALKTKVFEKKITENFYVLKGMQAGTLWWRVRSVSGTTMSPFSKSASFTIQ